MKAVLSVCKQTGSGTFQIEGFSLLLATKKTGDDVSSGPIITIGDLKFGIGVLPRGSHASTSGWMRAEIVCFNPPRKRVVASHAVSVVNQRGGENHWYECENADEFTRDADRWGWDNFIRVADLQSPTRGLVANDVVILEASVTVIGDAVLQSAADHRPEGAAGSVVDPGLSGDLGCLWASGAMSDVVLRAADGQELKAHGALLGARSPVFSRMLATGMREAATGVIEVDDVSPDVLRRLCEFIYTGTVAGEAPWAVDEDVSALLQAAMKYDVRGLVHLCAQKAMARVSVETVAEWLTLASRAQAESLRAHCLQFTAAHFAEVQDTEGWERLLKDKQVLAELGPELFQAISPSVKRRRTKR